VRPISQLRFDFILIAVICWTFAFAGCKARRDTPTAAPPPPVAPNPEFIATFDAAWRIIHETHFDTNFNGVDWMSLRAEYRPQAEQATNVFQLREVIQNMLDRLDQSHLMIIPKELARNVAPNSVVREKSPAESSNKNPSKEESPQPGATSDSENAGGDLGLDVRVSGKQVLVTEVEPGGPASAGGIKPGWVLRRARTKDLAAELEQLARELDPDKVPMLGWTMSLSQLLGRPGSRVSLEFLDEHDREIEMELERRPNPGQSVKFGEFPMLYARFQSAPLETPAGRKAGWLRFNVWMVPIAAPFHRAIDEYRGSDGIVLDLRGNTGGIAGMIMGLSGHFLKERLTLGTMKMRSNELRILSNPRVVDSVGKRIEPFAGPLAILVDEVTVSASEIFAGGMQAVGRARIFGRTTAGQALPAMFEPLPNGDLLYHAIADFITAKGTRLEARGVVPDEIVPLRRDDLLAGRDAVVEAALRWIDQEAKSQSARQSSGAAP
jgi:carboxyl-terminal processing protease